MPPTRSAADVHAAGATASIVSFVTWILGRYLFHGSVPAEVIGILFLTAPYALGVGAAWVARRRRLRDARDAAYLASLKPVQTALQVPPVDPPAAG
ncbi:hypothetical protein AB0D63_43390 [Kitasatospora sp. NPDC048343]|uniref:hypothetical protein n=1 Tax=Kitasatospora sp. NPDC048343 TaxID=3154717 RepID=UPI0033CD4C93